MAEEIHAWIVAIEKYAAGAANAPADELDIRSPIGSWSLEFAELLLTRGVLAANIVLSVSLPDRKEYQEPLAQLAKKGVALKGATLADLQNSLLQLHGDGTLLVYWVGHGIMDSDARYLLTGESQRDQLLSAVNATSLVRHFRDARYPSLQIGFFDCCAQVVATPNALKLSDPGEAPAKAQYFYFAASAGEYAAADTTRAGFSSACIQAIRETQELPPAPDPFFPDLRRKLKSLDLGTRPFLLEWTDGSGDQWSGAAGQPALLDEARRAELNWPQFKHLYEQAKKLRLTASQLSQAVSRKRLSELIVEMKAKDPEIAAIKLLERAWSRVQIAAEFDRPCRDLRLAWSDWLDVAAEIRKLDMLGEPQEIEDLQGLLLSILDQESRDGGTRSFIKLLALAARRASASNPAAVHALSERLCAQATLAPLYLGAVAELPAPGRLYLLLDLLLDANDQKVSLVNAWLYRDDKQIGEPWEIAKTEEPRTAAQMIQFEIEEVLKKYPECALVVEVLAPNNLLCAPRELFEISNPDLGLSILLEASYGIVVRWQNRMQGHADYKPGTWAQVARRVREHASNVARLGCGWPEDGALPPLDSFQVIGLSYPGPCPAEPGRNRGAFFNYLLHGAPYMCWPRSPLSNPKAFQARFSTLVEKSRSIDDLAKDVCAAKQEKDSALDDLILFIDEPGRNPYEKKLQPTRQREAS